MRTLSRTILALAALWSAAHAIADAPTAQSAQRRLIGTWESGECDSQQVMCSQMRLQLSPTGIASWNGYPKFHGSGSYQVMAVEDNRLIVQFTNLRGDVGPEPFTARFALQPNDQSLIELERNTRGNTYPRTVTWRRVQP